MPTSTLSGAPQIDLDPCWATPRIISFRLTFCRVKLRLLPHLVRGDASSIYLRVNRSSFTCVIHQVWSYGSTAMGAGKKRVMALAKGIKITIQARFSQNAPIHQLWVRERQGRPVENSAVDKHSTQGPEQPRQLHRLVYPATYKPAMNLTVVTFAPSSFLERATLNITMAVFETISINAPSLGAELTGVLDSENDIALFRGIPFATVTKRWTHSETTHSLEKAFDATKLGYRCSQGSGMVLVSGGTNDPLPGDDEFKCLNLNIAVPKEYLKSSQPLPVMVWIHGYALPDLIKGVTLTSHSLEVDSPSVPTLSLAIAPRQSSRMLANVGRLSSWFRSTIDSVHWALPPPKI